MKLEEMQSELNSLISEIGFYCDACYDDNEYRRFMQKYGNKLIAVAQAAKQFSAYTGFLDSPDGNALLDALEKLEQD